MAFEAKYHKACHAKYIVKEKKPSQTFNPHVAAFDELIKCIKPELDRGRAYDMNQLLSHYQTLLQDHMSTADASKFTCQGLKAKLQTHCSDYLMFHSSPDKPDIVTSNRLILKDIINTIADMKKTLQDVQAAEEVQVDVEGFLTSSRTVFFYAALILRSAIRSSVGIQHQPLKISQISADITQEEMVHDDVYSFLYWMLCIKPPESAETVDKLEVKESSPLFHRKLISTSQDLVYISSKGKCRTPKHLGLGIAMHQITQSEDVVTMLNRQGQCVSYDEVQRIETCWAHEQLKDDVFIPMNMAQGQVTRCAGDNFNRATESLQGEHHDVVNMVLYLSTAGAATFGNVPQLPKISRSRTVEMNTEPQQIIVCPNMHGKQPGPRHLFEKVNLDWYQVCSAEHMKMKMIDQTLILLCQTPRKLFEADLEKVTSQAVPGWTVFHAIVTPNQNVKETNIGYCPMIPASSAEFDTIYTMMKVFQRMFQSLGLNWTWATYDEAIYAKAQMIKWQNPDKFANDKLEMGGMHRAMNFMGDIGHIMESSGFEDILVEANVYGSSTVQHAMKGKAYNRGVRIHKLMNEAMNRLKWCALGDWAGSGQLPPAEQTLILNQANICLKLFENLDKAHEEQREILQQEVAEFTRVAESLNNLMSTFVAPGKSCSDTFVFWENYVSDYSQLLLDYIAAKRDDKKDLELETFAEMLPLDFMCGHTNYARWGTVNVAEQRLLQQEKPEIYEALSNGHGTVNRSAKPFSGIWHDMAIEQSLNKDCGKFQHVNTKEETLTKYYLTAHFKASVTAMTKKMCGYLTPESNMHKESSSFRITKDEETVEAMTKVVVERMTNPFIIEEGTNKDNRQPLINIFTKTTAPKDVTDCVLKVRKHGQQALENFVRSRLNNQEVDLFDTLSKPT